VPDLVRFVVRPEYMIMSCITYAFRPERDFVDLKAHRFAVSGGACVRHLDRKGLFRCRIQGRIVLMFEMDDRAPAPQP
jgi:hypothetical protein